MFKFSNEGLKTIQKELARYESKRSAILPCLYVAQKENGGWVSKDVVSELSRVMDVPEIHINEVLSFYTMYNKKPVGKYHVQVCCNISCSMNGSRELFGYLLKEFKANDDEMTADGKFTFSRVECLGSCGTAPMMQVNEDYHENLTEEQAVKILKNLTKGN